MRQTLVLLIALFSIHSFADTIDRIDDCERKNGANGCVYSILRELSARSNSGESKQKECLIVKDRTSDKYGKSCSSWYSGGYCGHFYKYGEISSENQNLFNSKEATEYCDRKIKESN